MQNRIQKATGQTRKLWASELLRTNYLPLSWIPEDKERREKRFIVKDRVRYGIRRSDIKGLK
ncbi:MAG: hypothetical protein ACRDF4_04590 [Rhabdochlamydiaceae bacterium]